MLNIYKPTPESQTASRASGKIFDGIFEYLFFAFPKNQLQTHDMLASLSFFGNFKKRRPVNSFKLFELKFFLPCKKRESHRQLKELVLSVEE